ncbi:DUF4907 domain-containing protein [Adhaeribacter terreus]|uniref:DUF4907 domain-containing protein n=1 Tax=Adhaeribacter terreus TaxID=529703 RepID=A0ABW0EG43_9BACT
MKSFLLISLAIGLHACETNQPQQNATATFQGQTDTVFSKTPNAVAPAFPEATSSAKYTYQIIPAENGTFGYEIKQDSRTFIRQITIPGLPGNAGFTTKEEAEKVAELVITKLQSGEMPPTVSEVEMKQIGAIK